MLRNEEVINIELEQTIGEDDSNSAEAQAQRDFDTALRYIHIAEHMKQYEDQDKYYIKAQKCFTLAKPYIVDKELEKEVSQKKYYARAMAKIEGYKEAMAIKEKASTPEDYYAAQNLFQKIHTLEERRTIPEGKVSDELYQEVLKYSDSADQVQQCIQLSEACKRKHKIKSLVLSTVVIAICLTVLLTWKTAPFRRGIAYMAGLIGDAEVASNGYKYAYDRTGDPADYDHYLEQLYKCSLKQEDSETPEDALNGLSILAMEGYQDSADHLVAIEKKIISKADMQNGKVKVGNMEWRILERDEEKALLLKDAGISDKTFCKKKGSCTWAESEARRWLNDDFLTENFCEAEIANMQETEVKTPDHPVYGTSGGETTKDKVFLLSMDEVTKYKDLIHPTETNWWLRSPGANAGSMAFVYTDKTVMDYGYDASVPKFSFKPVLYFKLK